MSGVWVPHFNEFGDYRIAIGKTPWDGLEAEGNLGVREIACPRSHEEDACPSCKAAV